jgi:hypothetical protein
MAQASGSGPDRARVLEKVGVKNGAKIVQYAIRIGLVIFHPKWCRVRPACNLFSGLSLPVRQTPTNLSARVLRKNQPEADVHDRRRDLFFNPMKRFLPIRVKVIIWRKH